MITEEQEKRLQELVQLFLEENTKINLSAMRDEKSIWIGSILDSLVALDLDIFSSIPQPLPPKEEGELRRKSKTNEMILNFARGMRKNQTEAEEHLWKHIRHDVIGVRFRRQYPFKGAIFDFYCPKLRLAIEVDGNIHESNDHKKEDAERDTFFESEFQIQTLRFTNQEILRDVQSVLTTIKLHVEEKQSSPPPMEEGSGVEGLKILDIGTGGGFPLLPLAICLSDCQFVGMDSTQKKLDAIKRMVDTLQLNNVQMLAGRCEEKGHDAHHRQQYDIVTARAVAPLNVLLEYGAPFVKPGGHLVAWKSMKIDTELEESLLARAELSCHLIDQYEYELPEDWGKRQLLIFEKTDSTHTKYPRDTGIPKKNPLL